MGFSHPRWALLANQLRQAKVLGLPIQSAAVAVISVALVIYLSGWAALSRVEARSDSYRAAAFGEPVVLSRPNNASDASHIDAENRTWERVALFVCPLH